MVEEVIREIKGIDFVFLFIFCRICYIAQKRGMVCEIIKLCGVWVASFFSFQFYPLLVEKIFSSFFSAEKGKWLAFLIIFFSVLFFFFLVRVIFSLFEKQNLSAGERVGGMLLGMGRAVLVISVFLFVYDVSPLKGAYVRDSLSYKLFSKVAIKVYLESFNLYRKIDKKAKVNEEVEEYYEAGGDLSGSGKEGNRG